LIHFHELHDSPFNHSQTQPPKPKLTSNSITKLQERLKFKFVLRKKSKEIPSAHKPEKYQGSHSPLWQLHYLLMFMLLFLVALLRHLLNAAKGGNWLHPSIVDGGMDGKVDWMKKTSFHHDHILMFLKGSFTPHHVNYGLSTLGLNIIGMNSHMYCLSSLESLLAFNGKLVVQ